MDNAKCDAITIKERLSAISNALNFIDCRVENINRQLNGYRNEKAPCAESSSVAENEPGIMELLELISKHSSDIAGRLDGIAELF